MMNCSTRAATWIPKPNFFSLQSAFFHASPVLQRKRRNFWDTSSQRNSYSRRSRRMQSKQSILRNFNRYADYIFQNWDDDPDEELSSSSRGSSWFKKQYSKGSTRTWAGNKGSRHGGKSFQFCEDDFEVESIFRSAFGGNRFFYWSFINEEEPKWKSSSRYSDSYQRSWRHRYEEDYDSSDSDSESKSSESDLASDRLALGLSTVGPLKLEDVKKAYRACALKWHPDRHQGSSKAVAEQKFKVCSAAYQSLCDRLVAA
ncbi:hypothetical protein Tsubulata_038765 [Turnera subulata]|uniref:J domain-containing protein n=1 Tax=Turnera subulata TaxID=218843 RepID=A0A9Q0J7A7_9ROSI|nr:hypothetical protein Tsubulata_038765 [Turnera subulata]